MTFSLSLKTAVYSQPVYDFPRIGFIVIAIILGALTPTEVCGQSNSAYNIGPPPLTANIAVPGGNASLANGNLHLEIPLGLFPLRGGSTANFSLVYDSNIWREFSYGWFPQTSVDSSGIASYPLHGWRLVNSLDPGRVFFNEITGPACYKDSIENYNKYNQFTYTEPSGAFHAFDLEVIQGVNNQCGNHTQQGVGDSVAIDGSGYHIFVTGGTNATVYAPNGTAVYATKIEDTNGNYTSQRCVNGCSFIDDLGRIPVVRTINGNQRYYDVLNSKGSTSRFTVTTESINVSTNFGSTGWPDYAGVLTVIQGVQLPDGTSYSFSYDAGTTPGNYGQVKAMTLPTGGTINYSYSSYPPICGLGPGGRGRGISSVSTSDGTWSIGAPQSTSTQLLNCQVSVTVTKPSGDNFVETFLINGGTWPIQRQYYTGGVAPTNLIATTTESWDFSHQCPSSSIAACTDFVATSQGVSAAYITKTSESVTLPLPGGSSLTKTSKFIWDSTFNGNLIQRKDWNYYSGTLPAAPDRTLTNIYQNSANYVSAHIVNRPTSETVTDKNGATVSQTLKSYDGSPLVPISSVVNHDDTNFGTNNNIRGNLTGVQRLVSGTSNFISTAQTFDATGQVVTSADANGHITSYGYADNFYNDQGDGLPPAPYSPGSTTNAYLKTRNQGALVSTFGYYWGTGQKALTTDSNDETTYSHFYDPLSRPTSLARPDGGWNISVYPSGSQIQVDTASAITSKALTINCPTSSNACRHDQVLKDAFGRETSNILVSDPDGATIIGTAYDVNGRVLKVSNPYRSTTDPTYGWTTSSYDGLDRVIQIQKQDGNLAKTYHGATVSSGGGATAQLCASSSYGYGFPELTVDEAGNKRQTWTDGFGRLIEVDEPNSTGALVVPTCYGYDLNDNLVTVIQNGSRQRNFSFDLISRMTRAVNPESGTATYSYDSNGNLASKTSPAPNQSGSATLTTSYCYDSINRLVSKTYSLQSCPMASPLVSYYYDQTNYQGLSISNGKGRRTGMADASGSEAWSYSSIGRVLADQRITNNISNTFNYTYNLDGSIGTITYPGKYPATITYTQNSAGRPIQLDFPNVTYHTVGNVHYAPNGVMCSEVTQWGTITQGRLFNNRLQPGHLWAADPTNGTLPVASNSNPCPDISFTGGEMDLTYSFVDSSSHNNGSPVSETNKLAPTRSQTFTYDSLNRVSTAQTTSTASTSPGNCWAESYSYDAWGNLYARGLSAIQQSNYAGCLRNEATFNYAANVTPNNQLIPAGYSYDSAGNLLTASVGGTPSSYTYDAENHLLTLNPGNITYGYDGNSKRVTKSSGNIYYYGTNQSPMYVTDLSGNYLYQNFYFNGELTARSETNNWLDNYVHDRLGSTRYVYGNVNGTYAADFSDFYPFGGEIAIADPDPQPYKFTGKERDPESGMDNFGARYFGANMGRFLSPDPENLSATFNVDDPQSWNGYTYARNNPLIFTDPDGRNYVVCNEHGDYCVDLSNEQYEQYRKDSSNVYSFAGNLYVINADGSDTKIGTVAYYDEQAAKKNAAAAKLLSGPVLNVITKAAYIVAGATTAVYVGTAYATYGVGTTVLNIGAATAPLLPIVPSALTKLQQLGLSLEEACAIIQNPSSQKLVDNLNNGNINVIQDIGGKLIRITLDPSGQRIISAGIVQARNITNSIANGRFTPIQ